MKKMLIFLLSGLMFAGDYDEKKKEIELELNRDRSKLIEKIKKEIYLPSTQPASQPYSLAGSQYEN